MAKSRAKKPGVMTVLEAASDLRVSLTQVYRWLDDETLEEFPVRGRARLVVADSVAELKREREVT